MLQPSAMHEGVSTGVWATGCIAWGLLVCHVSLCPLVHVCFTCGCMGGVHSWHAQMHQYIHRYHASCLGLDACLCLSYMPDNRLGRIVRMQVQVSLGVSHAICTC